MKYYVYTDGATNDKKFNVASSYLIYTDERFIYMNAMAFNSRYASVAETLAIGLAAQHMLENVELNKDDIVRIYTDSKAAKTYIEDSLGGEEKETKDERIKIVIQTVKELSKRCDVRIIKVKAHTADLTGNNVADRLAKMTLSGEYRCLY